MQTQLTVAEIQRGLNIATKCQRILAQMDLLQQMEAEFIAELRMQRGLGQDWVLRDWFVGFEQAVENGDTHD